MKQFRLTKLSCYLGIFVQAIVCNVTAILFIPMMELYSLNYIHLGILVAVNFIAQVAVDVIFSGFIDKYGYRKMALPSIACAFFGLLLFAASPNLFGENVFAGFVISTVIFAAASGLLEVMISPITDSIPSDDKGASMSLMHSFYAWGQVLTVVVTTLFVFLFGGKNWQIVVLIWALFPLVNFIMFYKSKFPDVKPEQAGHDKKKVMFSPFYLLALAAIFFGAAAEVTMAQWSSSFMEKALVLPKLTGDMLGMCGFAVMMGVGRLIYGIMGSRLNMNRVLMFGAAVATICYVTVAISPYNWLNLTACAVTGFMVSLLWPGTLVLSSTRFPMAGAWMFAVLAAAGDVGAAFGPWITGVIVDYSDKSGLSSFVGGLLNVSGDQATMRAGILVAAIFPLLAMVCHMILNKITHSTKSGSKARISTDKTI